MSLSPQALWGDGGVPRVQMLLSTIEVGEGKECTLGKPCMVGLLTPSFLPAQES